MKINDLIKQLNAMKKIHGNIEVCQINGETGRSQSIESIGTFHPIGVNGCFDKTKPAYAIMLRAWK